VNSEEAFFPHIERMAPRLSDLADLDEEGFRSVFAGSPVKRTGHQRMRRNVLTAVTNATGAGPLVAAQKPVGEGSRD